MDRDLRNRFMFLVDVLNLISHSPHVVLINFGIAVGIVELFPQPSDIAPLRYYCCARNILSLPDIFKDAALKRNHFFPDVHINTHKIEKVQRCQRHRIYRRASSSYEMICSERVP